MNPYSRQHIHDLVIDGETWSVVYHPTATSATVLLPGDQKMFGVIGVIALGPGPWKDAIATRSRLIPISPEHSALLEQKRKEYEEWVKILNVHEI